MQTKKIYGIDRECFILANCPLCRDTLREILRTKSGNQVRVMLTETLDGTYHISEEILESK